MNIPLCYDADPNLGRWAYQQRANNMKMRKGKGVSTITKNRLDRLREIGFSFHLDERSIPDRQNRKKFPISTNNMDKPDAASP